MDKGLLTRLIRDSNLDAATTNKLVLWDFKDFQELDFFSDVARRVVVGVEIFFLDVKQTVES